MENSHNIQEKTCPSINKVPVRVTKYDITTT